MRPAAHARLLLFGVAVWAAFWVGGFPDYYQQYSFTLLAGGSVLIAAAVAFLGGRVILRARPERRLSLSWWLSLYVTAPFAC